MVRRDRAAGRGPGAGRRDATRPARTAGISGAGDLAAHRTRLQEVIRPVVEAAGYDLEELAVSRAGRRYLLRITVDAARKCCCLHRCFDTAEETGGDFGSGEYVLEVSSPGVDRPLREPRHWRRNVGRLVEVPVGDRKVTGRVVDADESGVTLEVGGDRHGYAYPELGAGRVQVEFGHVDDLDDDMDDDAEEDGE